MYCVIHGCIDLYILQLIKWLRLNACIPNTNFNNERKYTMYSIMGLLVFVLDIFAIIKIIQSSATGTEKILWVLGVLVFPVVGLIVWYFAGPGGKRI